MLQMVSHTAKELADMYEYTLEEVAEWYGKDADKFYWVCTGTDEESAHIGVRFKNGTFAVYGCRLDIEGLTYEQMAKILFSEFNK